MARVRKIVGVQVHHSVALADASAYAANLAAALRGAARMVQPEHRAELEALEAEAQALAQRVGMAGAAARLRIQMFQSDREFSSYVDGDLPWPDEDPEGFEARCRCDDACLLHDRGLGTEDDCNCAEPCRRHP